MFEDVSVLFTGVHRFFTGVLLLLLPCSTVVHPWRHGDKQQMIIGHHYPSPELLDHTSSNLHHSTIGAARRALLSPFGGVYSVNIEDAHRSFTSVLFRAWSG